ncbi:peptidase S24/S26A/S26B/S26C [Mycena amicta]|nr:peptidase S24/S26A/S26B/S26C [Mycena amicta]
MMSRTLRVLYWSPMALFFTNFYTVKQVSGRSMQPTLNPDTSLLWRDIGVFDRVFLLFRPIRRGDIVALTSPYNPQVELVKRVVAVEGDAIRTLPPYPELVIIPKGKIWVEGACDAFHSQDSNVFGAVPIGLVDSRLLFLCWPVWRFGYTDFKTPSSISSRVSPASKRFTNR